MHLQSESLQNKSLTCDYTSSYIISREYFMMLPVSVSLTKRKATEQRLVDYRSGFEFIITPPVSLWVSWRKNCIHYNDIIMRAVASQITSVSIVYSTIGSGTNERKHQRSASLAFIREIHRWPVNSPHVRPVTRKNVSIWWRHHV